MLGDVPHSVTMSGPLAFLEAAAARGRLAARLLGTPRLRAGGSHRPFAARGEEHVLRALIGSVPGLDHSYVDIGASDGLTLSNTARLALAGWRGVCFEYDPEKVAVMAVAYRDLTEVRLCRTRITPLNVRQFLDAFAVPRDVGVLSLDIDSYDYFVLEALLATYRPGIIVTEINEKIPPPLDFTVLFDERHSWPGNHFYGQSICRLEALCEAQDYAIAHLEYNNAFLVDGRRYGGARHSAGEAYAAGYRDRPDRARQFPWNRDMDDLLGLPAAAAAAALRTRFAAYEGRFALSLGSDEPAGGGSGDRGGSAP